MGKSDSAFNKLVVFFFFGLLCRLVCWLVSDSVTAARQLHLQQQLPGSILALSSLKSTDVDSIQMQIHWNAHMLFCSDVFFSFMIVSCFVLNTQQNSILYLPFTNL